MIRSEPRVSSTGLVRQAPFWQHNVAMTGTVFQLIGQMKSKTVGFDLILDGQMRISYVFAGMLPSLANSSPKCIYRLSKLAAGLGYFPFLSAQLQAEFV